MRRPAGSRRPSASGTPSFQRKREVSTHVDAGELGQARGALRLAAQRPGAVAVVGEVERGAADSLPLRSVA